MTMCYVKQSAVSYLFVAQVLEVPVYINFTVY